MEPKELSLPRKLFNAVIILGIGWCILMGFIWLVSKAPESKSVTLSRGRAITVDAKFRGPSMGSTREEIYLPEKTFLDRNWQGRSFRKDNAGRYEVIRKGESRGVQVTLGQARIENGRGIGQVTVRAFADTPPGTYKVWVKGAYHDYTRIGFRAKMLNAETKDKQEGFVIPTVVVDVK